MNEDFAALARFREAAIEWAMGARGQRIVDAAATALADGLDSPSLRMLAGTSHSTADEEAPEFAPLAFRELGLDVKERLSPDAYVDGARLEAQRLLDGVITERELVRGLSRFFAPAGYPTGLSIWAGLEEYYSLIDDGVINVPATVLDQAARAAAEDLVNHRQGRPVTIASIFQAPAAPPNLRRRWLSRIPGRSPSQRTKP